MRDCVNRLGAVRRPEQAVASVIEKRALFEIVGPIGDPDRVTGLAISLNGILINCGVNHPQIVQYPGSLRALTGAKEAGDGNGRQQCDDGDNNHNFYERKTFMRLDGEPHNMDKLSSRHANVSMADILADNI